MAFAYLATTQEDVEIQRGQGSWCRRQRALPIFAPGGHCGKSVRLRVRKEHEFSASGKHLICSSSIFYLLVTDEQYFTGANIEPLPWRKLYDDALETDKEHGTQVAMMVLGKKGDLQTGVTPETNIVAFDNREKTILEADLVAMLLFIEHLDAHPDRKGRCSVNMSFGINKWPNLFEREFCKYLADKEEAP